MFDQLVESLPHRERNTIQTVISVAAHTVIIAASIQLTRAAAENVASRPHENEMVYANHAVRSPVQAARSSATAMTNTDAFAAAPIAPTVVPVGIPPVNPGAGVPAARFDPRAFGTSVPNFTDTVTKGDTTALTAQQVDEPVKYLEGPSPAYPPVLRTVGISGSVILQYIVGRDGRVEQGSIHVVRSTNTAFETPSSNAIALSLFSPATVGSRTVRQLVEQVVRFTIK